MKKKMIKGHQNNLFMQEKTHDEILNMEMVIFNKPIMKPFLCNKHKHIFWRNMEMNYGMCWYCKDIIESNGEAIIEDIEGERVIKTYPLQSFHTSDLIVIKNYFNDIDKGNGNMTWEEKKGISTKEWEKKGDIVIGKLIEKQEKIGENESTLFTIEQENGEKIGVWESGFLKIPMASVKIGDKVKIEFDGLGKPKQKGFNPPKLFKVFIDK